MYLNTVCYEGASTGTVNGAARNEKISVFIVELETYVESQLCRIIMRFADLARDKQVGINIITSVNMHFLFLFVFLTYFAFWCPRVGVLQSISISFIMFTPVALM